MYLVFIHEILQNVSHSSSSLSYLAITHIHPVLSPQYFSQYLTLHLAIISLYCILLSVIF